MEAGGKIVISLNSPFLPLLGTIMGINLMGLWVQRYFTMLLTLIANSHVHHAIRKILLSYKFVIILNK